MLSLRTKLLATATTASLGIPVVYVYTLMRREQAALRRMNETLALDWRPDFAWLWQHGLPLSQRILVVLAVVLLASTALSVFVDVLRRHASISRI